MAPKMDMCPQNGKKKLALEADKTSGFHFLLSCLFLRILLIIVSTCEEDPLRDKLLISLILLSITVAMSFHFQKIPYDSNPTFARFLLGFTRLK